MTAEKPSHGKKKRVFPRKPLFVPVNFSSEGRAYQDFIRNISTEGVFIDTRVPLQVGQQISMVFPLPSRAKEIKISGEVVRVSPEGVGVRFSRPKETEEPEPQERPFERRGYRRFRAREGAFALLNRPSRQLGEIVDISKAGMGFTYSSDVPIPRQASELDIMFLGAGFYLRKLPFETRVDLRLSGTERRHGVQFAELTRTQKAQLDWFIRNYTNFQ